MNSERRGLVVVVAVLLVSAVLGGIYGPNVRATTASADDYQTAVRDFTRVLNVVQNNYADTVDVDKAVYQGAIPGMLRMLDPHSRFFDAKQGKLLGIEETRVGIKHAQHARNGALIDSLIYVDRIGIVVLNHVQNSGKVPYGRLIIVRRSGRGSHVGTVNAP